MSEDGVVRVAARPEPSCLISIPHHAFRGEGSDRMHGDMTHKHWTDAAEPGELAFVTTTAEGLRAASRGLDLETASRTYPAPPKRSVCIVLLTTGRGEG